MRSKAYNLSLLSVAVATAMILSFIESRLPTFVPIPGIKLGLANIAVIFAIYKLGWKEAIAVSLVRVCLSAMLFGSAVSFIYSLTGAVVSFAVMLLLKTVIRMHTVGVSIAGGVAHNIGQIVAASVILSTDVVVYYMPYLIISGVYSFVLCEYIRFSSIT